MFDRLKMLVEKMELPVKNYRVAKENREVLQQIKVECQNLRKAITVKVKAKDYDKEVATV
jgi:hypothetical protein